MTELVYQTARRLAQELLDRYWDNSLPVKLQVFADHLNVEVYEVDLGRHLSGVVSKDEDLPARIVINSRDSSTRRRFAWAHELGHVVEREYVSKSDSYSFEDINGEGEKNLHDFFANEFALALLMPEFELLEMVGESLPENLIAKRFNVTVEAVRDRLGRLAKNPA